MNNKPLVYTLGEPAGIGADLIIQWAQQDSEIPLVVLGSADLLQQRAAQLNIPLTLNPYALDQIVSCAPRTLTVWDQQLGAPVQAGVLNAANSASVCASLTLAAQRTQQGQFSALVTGPVHKGIMNQAGIEFTGHTEWFAQLSHCPVTMMLVTKQLRIALCTTHVPLRQIPDLITKERVLQTIQHTHDYLQQLQIESPHIKVAGLNPHAGEQGNLGSEEQAVIEPAIDQARGLNIDVQGCFAADTLFTPKYLTHTDAFVVMYHDQGLPVLKHIGFGQAVNITLGLPYLRTSVDHGVALDIAGTGKADISSLQHAIDLARQAAR